MHEEVVANCEEFFDALEIIFQTIDVAAISSSVDWNMMT